MSGIKFNHEKIQYINQDILGVTRGDLIELDGEQVIFIDKYINANGYHIYNFFKEEEIVNGIVANIHSIGFENHPKPNVFKIIKKSVYKLSKRNWSQYEFNGDDGVLVIGKCTLAILE